MKARSEEINAKLVVLEDIAFWGEVGEGVFQRMEKLSKEIKMWYH